MYIYIYIRSKNSKIKNRKKLIYLIISRDNSKSISLILNQSGPPISLFSEWFHYLKNMKLYAVIEIDKTISYIQ